ncbi:SIMPL domain-containing protein [Rodentibacter caecimuris]|uniref:SIMPL domain-containing protein n=1 Tax=Rodentibacter caecimuris TaxID=1796644 RepID=A0ABX3KWS3_9PAST|nr:hypothetical protein BKG89_08685 [Rodentibacter heylii]
MKLKKLGIALLVLPLAFPVLADELTKNRISFSIEAEREVARDLLQVTLFYQEEGNNLSALNKSVMDRLNKALSVAKTQSAVEIKDNYRHTRVRYNQQGKQSGWIDRGEIVLESKDFVALSTVIGELEGILAVDHMQASVSSEMLSGLESQLTQDVLDKFKHKAKFIQNSLNMKGYRILSLDISSVHDGSTSRPYMLKNARATTYGIADTEGSNVYAESGKEKVKTQINAQIELLNE